MLKPAKELNTDFLTEQIQFEILERETRLAKSKIFLVLQEFCKAPKCFNEVCMLVLQNQSK